jgi:uncharacterized protein YjcR
VWIVLVVQKVSDVNTVKNNLILLYRNAINYTASKEIEAITENKEIEEIEEKLWLKRKKKHVRLSL